MWKNSEIKAMIFENLGIKIVSLIIAVILWYYAIIIENPYVERVFSLNVIANNLSSDWIIDSITESVKVRVKGKRFDLLNLFTSGKNWPLNASILLSDQKQNFGESKIIISNSETDKLQVVSVEPEYATYKLFKQVSKEVPVDYQRVNKPADGFNISSVTLEPKKVTITGKTEQLDKIFSARIEPIDISGAVRDVPKLVKVKLFDRSGNEIKNIGISPPRVLALVKIDPWPQKKVDIKTTFINEPMENFEMTGLSIEPSSVMIRMERKELEKLNLIYIPEPIDLKDSNKSFEKECRLYGGLLKKINFVSSDTVKVFVEISRKNSEIIPGEKHQK